MQRPPFRADHIGSLLRPQALRQAYRAFNDHLLDEAGFVDLNKLDQRWIQVVLFLLVVLLFGDDVHQHLEAIDLFFQGMAIRRFIREFFLELVSLPQGSVHTVGEPGGAGRIVFSK